MAELFLHISVSLDGYLEDAQGDIEWMTSDTSFDDYSTALLQSIDGMIFGRKAHALLAEFWPTVACPLTLFAGASAAQAPLERHLIDDIRVIQHPVLVAGCAEGSRRHDG